MALIKAVSFSNLNDPTNKRHCWLVDRVMRKCYKCKSYDSCESKIVNEQYEECKAILVESGRRLKKDWEEFKEAIEKGEL